MRNFNCVCGQLLFFENTQCGQCGKTVAFDPRLSDMQTLQLIDGQWTSANGQFYRHCQNSTDYSVCNWLVEANNIDPYCVACRLNEIIPDLSAANNMTLWATLEAAKRRLVYTLLQLNLPVASKQESPATGLAFAFLDDQGTNPSTPEKAVLTGYHDGLITINLREADNLALEWQRHSLGESYRTLLGHFRHESGHYYFDRFVRNGLHLEAFRKLFGNELDDYDSALQNYYRNKPAENTGLYISAYAQAHPLEDWAETWAHYLHFVDALETATAHKLIDTSILNAGFDQRLHSWIELSVALNNLNRSMGLKDAYPFVLSAAVTEKLRFVDTVIQSLAVA